MDRHPGAIPDAGQPVDTGAMGTWARRWWRDARYLLVGAGLGAAGYGLLVLTVLTAGLSLLGVGLPLLIRTVGATRGLADRQRRRVAEPVASPYPPMPPTTAGKVATIARTPATWRDLGWLALPTQLVLALVEVALCLGALQGLLVPLLWLVLPGGGVDYNGIKVDSRGTSLIGRFNGLLLAVFAAVSPPALVRRGPGHRLAAGPDHLPPSDDDHRHVLAVLTHLGPNATAKPMPHRPPTAPRAGLDEPAGLPARGRMTAGLRRMTTGA